MPNVKEPQTEADSLRDEIAELLKQLTGQERMKVALAAGLEDTVTLYRYAQGVRKIPLAIKIRDAMQKVIAER